MITTVFLLRLILILCMIRNSLTPNLVLRALKDSISECREEWSDDFCEWLCDIVNLTLKALGGAAQRPPPTSRRNFITQAVVMLEGQTNPLNLDFYDL